MPRLGRPVEFAWDGPPRVPRRLVAPDREVHEMGKRATFVAAGAGYVVGACLERAWLRGPGRQRAVRGAHPQDLAARKRVARQSRRAADDANAATTW